MFIVLASDPTNPGNIPDTGTYWVGPWASLSTSLSLGFLISSMGLKILNPHKAIKMTNADCTGKVPPTVPGPT